MTRLFSVLCLLACACAAPAAAQPEGGYLDRLEIAALLGNRDFESLTALLEGVQERYESGAATDTAVAFAYEGIANSDPDHEPLLEEWVAAMPTSYVALAARGVYRANRGWAERGTRLSGKTTKAQFKGMNAYHDLALADLREVIERHPRFVVAYSEIIALAKARSRDALRDEILTLALVVDPASYEVRISYFFDLMPRWGGSYPEIRAFAKDTERYLDDNPRLAALTMFEQYVRALNHYEDKEYDEAIALYDQALDRGDSHLRYLQRGLAYYYKQDYERALADLSAALERWPQNVKALTWRSAIYRKLTRPDDALADISLAVRLEPFSFRANREHANVLIDLERYEQAVASYHRALHYAPHRGDIWYRIGWYLHYKLDRHEEAAAALKTATERSPDETNYWYHYGVALNQLTDCEIVAVLETYLALCDDGDDPDECTANRTDWASGITEHLVATGKCPDADPYRTTRSSESDEPKGFWELVANVLFEILQALIAEFADEG